MRIDAKSEDSRQRLIQDTRVAVGGQEKELLVLVLKRALLQVWIARSDLTKLKELEAPACHMPYYV